MPASHYLHYFNIIIQYDITIIPTIIFRGCESSWDTGGTWEPQTHAYYFSLNLDNLVLDSANCFELLNGINSSFYRPGRDELWGRLATQFFPFFGSQDIWVMPVWTDHFWGIPYFGRHLEITSGEEHQRQDRQNWHVNLTFQDTCVTCRAAFTILVMFLCYLYNIFNCIVEHEDNDQLEDHNGEFTEKKCVRGRLDWITLLPLQDSTKGASTKSLKIQI